MICHLDAYDDDDYDVRDHEIECFDIKGRRLVTTKASEAQNPSLVARPCPNRVLLLITNVDVDNITNVAGGAKQKAALSKRNSKSQHKGFSGVEEQT